METDHKIMYGTEMCIFMKVVLTATTKHLSSRNYCNNWRQLLQFLSTLPL